MPAGPPKLLEKLARFVIPSTCREEVLGDLHERYRNPVQYIGDVISTLPFLILRRVRRTTDILLFITDALLVYGSFLAAAWYSNRRTLTDEQELLRLAIPAGVTLLYLVLTHALIASRWSVSAVSVLIVTATSLRLVSATAFYGFWLSLLLDVGVRELLARTASRAQSAAGSPLLVRQNSERGTMSRSAKIAEDVGLTVLCVAIAAALIVLMPRMVYLAVVLLAWAVAWRYSSHR